MVHGIPGNTTTLIADSDFGDTRVREPRAGAKRRAKKMLDGGCASAENCVFPSNDRELTNANDSSQRVNGSRSGSRSCGGFHSWLVHVVLSS